MGRTDPPWSIFCCSTRCCTPVRIRYSWTIQTSPRTPHYDDSTSVLERGRDTAIPCAIMEQSTYCHGYAILIQPSRGVSINEPLT